MDGLAVTFVGPDEIHRVKKLEEFLGAIIKYTEIPAAADGLHSSARSSLLPAMTTLLINSGKKDKVRPGDIVGALTASSELSNESIGKITVQARNAFVSIVTDKVDTALAILSNGRVKRQKVRARILR